MRPCIQPGTRRFANASKLALRSGVLRRIGTYTMYGPMVKSTTKYTRNSRVHQRGGGIGSFFAGASGPSVRYGSTVSSVIPRRCHSERASTSRSVSSGTSRARTLSSSIVCPVCRGSIQGAGQVEVGLRGDDHGGTWTTHPPDPVGAAHFAPGQGAHVEVVQHHEPEEQVEDRQGRDAARARAQGTLGPADAVAHVQLYRIQGCAHRPTDPDSKIVYRRYASLFFVTGIAPDDNELIALEVIHRYVEILDRYFGNVCELDLYVYG